MAESNNKEWYIFNNIVLVALKVPKRGGGRLMCGIDYRNGGNHTLSHMNFFPVSPMLDSALDKKGILGTSAFSDENMLNAQL